MTGGFTGPRGRTVLWVTAYNRKRKCWSEITEAMVRKPVGPRESSETAAAALLGLSWDQRATCLVLPALLLVGDAWMKATVWSTSLISRFMGVKKDKNHSFHMCRIVILHKMEGLEFITSAPCVLWALWLTPLLFGGHLLRAMISCLGWCQNG